MTTTDLHILTARASHSDLLAAIQGIRPLGASPTGLSADLSVLQSWTLERLAERGTIPASTDGVVAPLLHQCFAHIPRRTLLDPGFWTWLATGPLRDYAVHRWVPDPKNITDLKGSVLERFQGAASMVGISRNSCSRLFWAAEASHSHTGGYDAVATIFKRADLFVQIFERKIGLSPMAAVVVSRELCDGTEDNWRNVIRRLNHVLTTTTLELMSDEQMVELLRDLST